MAFGRLQFEPAAAVSRRRSGDVDEVSLNVPFRNADQTGQLAGGAHLVGDQPHDLLPDGHSDPVKGEG